MADVQERYTPIVVGVDSTITLHANNIGGFLAKTAGTVTVTAPDGTVIVNAVPVAAGGYTPLPFYLGRSGGTFTTAGGASGTVAGG
jgi:hypothetical protein